MAVRQLAFRARTEPPSLYIFLKSWLADSRGISDRIPWVWQSMYFYCSNYVGNQFIIEIRHKGVWYMANIPQLMVVSRQSAMRRTSEQHLAVVYWPYTPPPRALLLKHITLTTTLCNSSIYRSAPPTLIPNQWFECSSQHLYSLTPIMLSPEQWWPSSLSPVTKLLLVWQ